MATRKIIYDNNTYYFNFKVFKELFTKEKFNRHITFNELEEIICEKLHISKEAIHNWRFEKNGPSDINIITELAKEFGFEKPSILLTQKGDKTINMLNDLQKQSVKKIYDSIIEYLDLFLNTNGFNDLWFDLKSIPEDREDELYEIVEKHIDNLLLVFKKEYFFLNKTDIYIDLENYIYNDIYDTFDGKLSYAFRFEAIPNGNPSTNEDYYKALNKINSIIEKYIHY